MAIPDYQSRTRPVREVVAKAETSVPLTELMVVPLSECAPAVCWSSNE